jgi:hypothetical protein
MKQVGILFIIGLLISACAPSRFVEPLQKKQIALGGSFGGPFIDFGGKPIPVPLSSIEAGYGLDSNITVFLGLHTTSLMFNNLHFDGGFTYKFLNQVAYKPNLSITPGFNLVKDLNDPVFKFWPTLDINAYWNYGGRQNYFYAGLNNMFELSKTMALKQPQKQRWLYNPQIGHVIKGKTGKYQFTTEVKLLGINQENTYSFVPWQSVLGKYGTTGFYLGFRYIF